MGLVRFRKGDWKSISRFVVITRTPTQVASHAQKFFLRHNNSTKKDTKRKRSRNSILDINFSFSDFPNINNVQDQQTSPLLENFSFSDFPNINNVQDQQTSPLLGNFSFSDLPADFLDYQQIDHVMDIQDDNLFSDDINTTLNNFPNYPPYFLDQQTQDITIPMDCNFPNHPTNFPDQQAQGGGIWYSTDYIDEPAQLDHQVGEIGYLNSYLDKKIQLAQAGGIRYSTNHPDEQVQPAQGGGVGYLTNFRDWQTG